MRQVRQLMGMPITIDIPEATDGVVFDKAFERLEQIDNRFSTYKPKSEVSRFARGEIKESDLSAELTEVIKACRQAEKWIDGYFSAWAAGVFDPSGYVKGWAIGEAGNVIEGEGFGTYCISAGGDILASSNSGKKWNIGIQDPRHKGKILNKISISNGVVCTSGNYERGPHIINPKTKQPADELLSVTITGPDITTADILATACFAMGPKAADFMKSQKNYQAIIIPHSQGSNR
ncbi:MAG: FAD:protein FMN transferase [Candidatus Saccharimonadales bacterium]